ncbi:MAG: family 16 glycosylhydrolase [Anaerolineales bacterium]|nr:family 16 glycosylhydrolase [Anaerolineales bacterium]
MNRIRTFFLSLLIVGLILSSCISPGSPGSSEWDRPGWTLVWHDEFEGRSIDLENWTFDIGGSGWGNNERQFYTDRPENARIEEGRLVIEAREEEFLQRDYTSARLKTQGLHAWTYGRIEARMQLPYGMGIWPAFWMLGIDIEQVGWPASGEIDIMEHIGRDATHVYGTVHGPGYSGGGGVGHFTTFPAGSLSDEFHVYAIEWEPDVIRWYVDEQQYFEVTPDLLPGAWVYDHPFFIIINLAVGGNWPGAPDESTIFPQVLLVDYVRVYQQPGQVGETLGRSGTMHLGAIEVEAQDNNDGTWQAIVIITVVDANDDPVEGAQVTGGWVGAIVRGETEGLTDATGTVRLASDPSERQGEVTFCVTNVTRANMTYDKSANERNCDLVEHDSAGDE